jgi:hypothetical protein
MDFFKRNEIRQKQLAFVWTRQVGDRVQLSEDYGGYPAWASGTITALTPGFQGFGMPRLFVTVTMDDGGELQEVPRQRADQFAPYMPILPHEDYFLSDEDKNA